MSSKTSDVLQKARELLAQPEHWARGRYAYNDEGKPRSSTDYDAVQFDLIGAIHRSACKLKVNGQTAEADAFALMRWATEAYNLAEWNDAGHRRHSHVIEALDVAIRAAKENEE